MTSTPNSYQEAELLERFAVSEGVTGLRFKVETWSGHLPGQHLELRLTAKTGEQAKRDYSIVAPPSAGTHLELGVAVVPDGEVSSYLARMPIGEKCEVRGPLGRHFIWTRENEGSLWLFGGGSGMTPLMSMLRHWREVPDEREIVIGVSARTNANIPYRAELESFAADFPNVRLIVAVTKEAPDNKEWLAERFSKETLVSRLPSPSSPIAAYVCGRDGFVEGVAKTLLTLGLSPQAIRTERFGESS